MTTRLPIPGSDDGDWGAILNSFLKVAHNADGTLSPNALSSAGGITSSQVGSANGVAGLNSSGVVPATQLGTGSSSSSNYLRGDGIWAVPNSGSSALANDADVIISSPSNNQALLYDSTANKWTNQGITELDVTNLTTDLAAKANSSSLATVAISGSYSDLSNKPTIPAAQVNSDWSANSGLAQVLNKPTLATVATSGSYTDLTNKPTIPAIDTTASDIQPLGSQSAGDIGKAADAGHVHTMPRLDQVSVPTAAVTLNGQKITGLANGTLGTDAAAYGQIPVVGAAGSGAGNALSANDSTTTNSRAPSGAAGGDLTGTYPNPTLNNTANVESIIAANSTVTSKAPLASPAFTGAPTAPTAASGTNTAQLATTAYVESAVTNGAAPDATSSTLGLIQLDGDLGGTATSPSVVKINGVSLPASSPTGSGQVLMSTSTSATSWQIPPSAPVSSVFGRTGAVVATAGDYTATQVGALPSTDDLSSIATANPTAGSWSNNGKAITGVSELTVSGLTGATAASRYVGATTSGAPVTGTFNTGDYLIDQTGTVWICTATGSPGTWTRGTNVSLDSTAADIQPIGTQTAGSTGKAADAGHTHGTQILLPGDLSLLAWASPLDGATTTKLLIAQNMYLVKVPVHTPFTATYVWIMLTSASAGTGASSGSYVGLYNSSGTLLSGSSDIGTSLTGNSTNVQLSLTTPQNLSMSVGSFVWVAILANLATTQPTLQTFGGGTNNIVNFGTTASTYRACTNGTTRTSLPSSITPSSNTTSNFAAPWVGLS